MIIIIEGPDGSGKTTLANKIAKQTGYSVIHNSYPSTDEDKKLMMQSYADIIKSGRNAIFDRCWYSEMVYGPIMRDCSAISYPDMYELERLLTKRGALIIHCTDNPDLLWQRATKRGEEYIKDYGIHVDICNGFNELFSVPHLVPVVKYDYKDV